MLNWKKESSLKTLDEKYKTVILDNKITRIIALSDIHSDIHAFIICLRDCAKVIKKKSYVYTNIHLLDEDTENLLEMNLNDKKNEYIDDLNYEWIGGNTHIVICGDILDGARDNETSYRDGINRCSFQNCKDLEYDQVEIKLLRFINSINKLAMKQKGRIYKILGNHDIANLANDTILINRFNLENTLILKNYYDNYTRQEYFKNNNPGSDLLFEDNAYMFLVINNNIFVHGQLDHTKSLEDYIIINNNLNGSLIDDWTEINSVNITTWGRKYSRDNNETNNTNEQINKCMEVRDNLDKIFNSLIEYNWGYSTYKTSKALRVIVGHCPQMFGNNKNIINSTFKNIEDDNNIQILSGEIKTGLQDYPNYLFGIGMECNKEHLDEFKTNPEITHVYDTNERYIYKVDVGSTRAFDYTAEEYLNFINNNLPNNIAQRTPQVLEITGDNNIKIIRSTVLNTRIHQPRQKLEELLKEQNHRHKLIIPVQASMHTKYLKYKNKYIELKKKNS